ncbi:tRNA adenosine(34) deaminase TadA [Methylophaga sp. OBS3]|uniref:tRNA adenosine(34) deaminase TadA n=1 Tax=Methylophaga sp. OBS3 TaxID=2991934 RepID=UPI0022576310|nr:tRNA adenosine(34) deaminase TadA [Methylophaga sp. OBS3]MCX4190529.1 tRNA adenosine(34) deaminase TadA [Methylophaga sp. OBS3]
MPDDVYWMQHALQLAEKAQAAGEVPVGAVIVQNDELIAEGYNQPISQHDATAHAEIMALHTACQKLQNYRLPGTTMYVTLEPCIMCAGALVHARIERLVYAASEPKTGAAGSLLDVFTLPNINHRVNCESGVLAEQSSQLLRDFFRQRR